MHRLMQWGWNEFFQEQFERIVDRGQVPARVAGENRGLYRLLGEAGESRGELAGRFHGESSDVSRWPAVGDWVLASGWGEDRARIEAVLAERTRICRGTAGHAHARRDQILAANVDTAFIVTTAGREWSLRRLERYLALVWESGASPVVVFNKIDLTADPEAFRTDIESVAVGVPVLLTSGARGDGLARLESQLKPGATAVFLGSSGVGKSTLVNALLGRPRQRVGAVRAGDGRGRHSTTSRELIRLAGGALLIDTPGLRQVALGQSAPLRSRDRVWRRRTARTELPLPRLPPPDGAGLRRCEAEQAGRLDAQRLDSYRKLERERDYLESRESSVSRADRLRRTKILMKAQKRFYRDKGKAE